jgi:hypothetical protein
LPDPSMMASYVAWVAACVQSESPKCVFPISTAISGVYTLDPIFHTHPNLILVVDPIQSLSIPFNQSKPS